MDELKIDGAVFYGYTIPISKGAILLIRGGKGMLGCGYFSLDTAEKLGDAMAIVSGVKSYDDMLELLRQAYPMPKNKVPGKMDLNLHSLPESVLWDEEGFKRFEKCFGPGV